MGIFDVSILYGVLPLAVEWAGDNWSSILRQGQALSVLQEEDARRVGVVHPEEIRVLIVKAIPQPQERLLKTVNDMVQLLGPRTAGLTLEHGI